MKDELDTGKVNYAAQAIEHKVCPPIIIYGPPGCGKSLNWEKLAVLFNRHILIEEWDGVEQLPNNSIVLTNNPYIVGNHIIHYDEAIQMYLNWASLVQDYLLCES